MFLGSELDADRFQEESLDDWSSSAEESLDSSGPLKHKITCFIIFTLNLKGFKPVLPQDGQFCFKAFCELLQIFSGLFLSFKLELKVSQRLLEFLYCLLWKREVTASSLIPRLIRGIVPYGGRRSPPSVFP